MKIYDFKDRFGDTTQIILARGTYNHFGNLAVLAYTADTFESFADITVNLEPLKENYAAIDTNDLGKGIVTFLEKEKIAERTSQSLKSGFCEYPVMRFLETALSEMEEM